MVLAAQAATAPSASVFSKWATRNTPGCAVGVSLPGGASVERGYGMADLEHDIAIEPDVSLDPVFELLT
jgi:CubicO group peptidase (beta-lactamase class C family)